jgi:hypothetical protein
MTNNILKKTLEASQIDYKTYINLSAYFRTYLSNCAKFGIPNPKSSFGTNDVVIRNINKSPETDAYGVTKKWKVVACAYGLIIGRRILPKRLGRIEVINDIARSQHQVTVEPDPDLIDSFLLGEESFDPNSRLNKSLKLRKQASKYNKSISKKITAHNEAEDYFESLSEGDVIYSSSSLIGLTTHPRSFTVVKIIRTMKCVDFIIVRLKSSTEISIRPRSILKCFVTTQQPYPLSKIISK